MSKPLEIRVHPDYPWIAVKDKPKDIRPWSKMVPGVTLTDADVEAWEPMGTARLRAAALELAEYRARHWAIEGDDAAEMAARVLAVCNAVEGDSDD